MYSPNNHGYYEPLHSAPLFPSSDPSDFTASFDHAFFPHPPEHQHSIPFPSTFPTTAAYPTDLPLDSSIFQSQAEVVVDSDFIAPPLSPSSAFESEGSGASSTSSSSSASASSPPPPSDLQYDADESPFQFASHSIDSSSPDPPSFTSTLLNSLSFNPHQLLAQLTTSLTSPSGPSEPKKRNRIPGLTAQQRAALKRQKHREIDTQRRHREQAAIGKLHSLVYQPLGKEKKGTIDGAGSGGRKRARGEWLDAAGNGVDQQDNNDDDSDADEEEGGEEGDSSKTAKDKVTILEHSARRLEQMQSIIHQLTAACTTQQNNNRLLLTQLHTNNQQLQQQSPPSPSSHPLALFHPPVAQQLDANLGNQSLYASLFLSASAPMFIIRCDTGCVVDLNTRMSEDSGWQRHHVVGRMMTAPYDAFVCETKVDMDRIMCAAGQRVLVEGSDGQLVPATKQNQYERSRYLIQQLYQGYVNQIDAVWRAQMRNGKVYEVMCKSYISGYRDVLNEEGRSVRRPNTVVFVCDTLNAVCVDGS